MKRLILAFGLALATATADAAPAEQANCVYDGLAEQDRKVIGSVMLDSMTKKADAPESPYAKQAAAVFEQRLKACVAQHSWSENESSAAISYSSTRLMTLATRTIMQQMGGDAEAADLFFAQNKYRILDEEAAGRSSQEWSRTRLVEMGFAPEKSQAFEAVWLYLGLLFQAEAEREAFVSGKTPEQTK